MNPTLERSSLPPDGPHSGKEDGVCFGFELEPEVERWLQHAAACVEDSSEAERALKQARRIAPERLEVLQALYKFHFYRGDLEQAQDFVFQSLVKAAIQGRFDHDWSRLGPEDADWSQPRGPARSFLYSLKALAAIRLRQNDRTGAERVLQVLERLDPEDQVGAEVVRDLLAATGDSDGE